MTAAILRVGEPITVIDPVSGDVVMMMARRVGWALPGTNAGTNEGWFVMIHDRTVWLHDLTEGIDWIRGHGDDVKAQLLLTRSAR